jgi:predicted RNase H-like nuclease (RuvC/YqgF family)
MPRIPKEESVQGKLATQEAKIQELQEQVLKLREEVKQLKRENKTLRRQKSMLDLGEEEEEIWKEVRSVPKSSLDWAPVEWVLNQKWVAKNPGVDPGSPPKEN